MAQPAGSRDSSSLPSSSGPAKGAAPGKSTTSKTASGSPGLTTETVRRIGKYDIQKKIGAGGMGTVFLAVDTILNRTVALKVLPHEKASNPTLVKRFKAEAQSAANLRHDNIVMVYEAGEIDGYLYIALEYVEGTDVANLVQKRGSMPVGRTVEVIGQVAQALQHAYEQGIVHRDIKPGNILLRRDGVAKLADLGLARAVDDTVDTSITRAGTTVGTVDYMSPEQARNSKAADVRSDLYSLGCTWYFMLTGLAPYPEGSLTQKLRAHAEVPLPDPRGLNPTVPEALVAVMRRMTEKDASQRYQTPADLLSDLETAANAGDMVSAAILEESDSDAAKTTGPRPGRKRPREEEHAPPESDSRARRRPAKIAAPTAEISSATFKSPRKEQEQEQRQPSELNRAITFYVVMFLVVGSVLSGLAWIAMQYGSTIDGPVRDPGGNPFAAANDAAPLGPGQGDAISPEQPGGVGQVPVAPPGAGSSSTGQATVGGINSSNSIEQRTVRVEGGGNPTASGGVVVVPGDSTGSKTIGPGTGGIGTAAGTSSGSPGVKSVAGAASAEARRKSDDALLPPWSRQSAGTGGSSGNSSARGTPPPEPPALAKLARLFVRRDSTDPQKYGSLNAALDHVPPEGAVIVLQGSGPFPLNPTTVSDKTRLYLRGDEDSLSGEGPLVVFTPPADHSAHCMLAFINTDLEIDRVHFALSAEKLAVKPGDGLLQSHGGALTLRNSSITATGNTAALAAVKLTMPPERKSTEPRHVLIDQSVIRGDMLSAVLVESPGIDLVIRSSLLWSGDAAALRLEGADATGKNGRTLRMVSSTVCSKSAAVCIAGDAGQPIPTGFEWINSLVTAPSGAMDPALCLLAGWSAEQQDAAVGKLFTWKSVSSHYRGWKSLLRRDPGENPVSGPTQWVQLWQDKSAAVAGQVHEAAWPERAISEIARVPLDAFAPESIGRQVVKTADGGWPGCSPAVLTASSAAALDLGKVTADRPAIPPGLIGAPFMAEIVQVDLNKQDLGKALSGRTFRNGTQIIATGFGPRTCSPIVIQNAWVQLRFEQGDGPPLVITPRGGESGKSSEPGPRPESFISVVNGGLEMSGGAFSSPFNERPAFRWFIQATDSDLALVRCHIQGSLLGGSTSQGLVRWTASSRTAPARAFSGPYAGYALFDRCFLLGGGQLIEADLRQRALFVRNSVLVSRDDLFALSYSGGQPEAAGVLELESSTLSAAGNFFEVDVPSTAEAAVPLSVFADRCVFAPPLRSAQQKVSPTLLAYSGPMLTGRLLNWWEDHCAYTSDVGSYLRESSETAGLQDFGKVWQAQWGSANVLNALSGPQAVALKTELPQKTEERARLEPIDFELHPSSRAASHDGAGGPVGAPVATLDVPSLRAPPAASGSGGKKAGRSAPAKDNKPAF